MFDFMEERRARHQSKATDNLFLLLDENFKKHFDRHVFWRDLHAIDREIVPRSIRLETPEGCAAEGFTGEDRFKGEQTLVIQLQKKQTAEAGALLLNHIFHGTGTRFFPETVVKDGHEGYRIRTNLDKQHWDKLCVFCQYRFEREVHEPQERQELMTQCQDTITNYTKGTPHYDWREMHGVPAFVGLMGLHGILRPKEVERANCDRMQAEFDSPHPRGVPLVFQGVKVHVELRGKSDARVVETPYSYGFDMSRAALEDATDRKAYWELLLESFGGNPFANTGWTSKAIYTVGLALGLNGAYHGAEEIIGWLGPAAAAGGAGVFIVGTYINHHFKILKQFENVRKDSEELRALEQEYSTPGKVQEVMQETGAPLVDIAVPEEAEALYRPSPIVKAILARHALQVDRQGQGWQK